GVLDELQPLDVVVAHGDDDATDAVAVAVQVFGRAVDDEIGAGLDRSLNVRARERVVDGQAEIVPVGDLGGGSQVGEREDGVGRRLDEQHPGLRRDRTFNEIESRRVDVRKDNFVPPEDLYE